MEVIKFDREQFGEAYGILCRRLSVFSERNLPSGGMLCINPQHTNTVPHNHHENECMFIISGAGRVSNGKDEPVSVGPGDVVLYDPFERHFVENMTDGDLAYLAVFWADHEAIAEQAVHTAKGLGPASRRVALITPPPTPNGDLHIGHLSGPYLGADVLKRYYQSRGVDVRYFSGIDDNQSYVATKAIAQNKSPQALLGQYGAGIKDTFAMASFGIDIFMEPSMAQGHSDYVRGFLQTLIDNGAVYKKQVEQPYCSCCDGFISEAFVRGTCPHCGESSDGNGCEACGMPNDCIDLVDATCTVCGKPATAKSTEKLYFRLTAYTDRLRDYIRETTMPGHLLSLSLRLLENGLQDIAASHHTDWGIAVDDKEPGGQKIYVWLEMAASFLYMAKMRGDEWGDLWHDKETRRVLLMGFDNSFYYTLLLPALFMAQDQDIHAPDTFITNEFYRLDGKKFSTSRNHAIWGKEILREHNVDALRLYIASTRPEVEQTNFSIDEFESFIRNELQKWEEWIKEIALLAQNTTGGMTVDPGAWTEEQQRYHRELLALVSSAGDYYKADNLSLRMVMRRICDMVEMARSLHCSQAHLGGVAEAYDILRTHLALQSLTMKALAMVAQPIAPGLARTLSKVIGIETPTWEPLLEFVAAGNEIRLDGILFPSPRHNQRNKVGT